MKDIQKYCLEILEELNFICIEKGIKFHLYSGTLLGAVREKGFIPWDDDIDVILLREDYNTLKNFLESNHLSKDLVYMSSTKYKSYPYSFDKIINNKIKLVTSNPTVEESLSGPWLDIFVYDLVSDDKLFRKKIYNKMKIIDFLLRINMTNYVENRDKGIKRVKKILGIINKHTFFKEFIRSKLRKKRDKISRKMLNPNGNSLADLNFHFTSFEDFEKFVIPLDQVSHEETVLFENKEFYGFKDNNYVLTKNFGNYMQRPPIAERKDHGIKILN